MLIFDFFFRSPYQPFITCSVAMHFPLQLFIVSANSTIFSLLPCPLELGIIICNRPTQHSFMSIDPLVNNPLTQHSMLECSLAHQQDHVIKNSSPFCLLGYCTPNVSLYHYIGTIMSICTLLYLILISGMYL
jgi:hypothetical protein